MKEKVSLDTIAKAITAMLFAIFLSIACSLMKDGMADKMPMRVAIFISVLFLLTIVFSWGFHPTAYEVDDDALLIHRPFGALKINKNKIVNIESIDAAQLRFGMRLFASGGFFGYFGLYTSKAIGRYYRYTGHSKNLLMIVIDKRKYVIGPDSETFAEAILDLGR